MQGTGEADPGDFEDPFLFLVPPRQTPDKPVVLCGFCVRRIGEHHRGRLLPAIKATLAADMMLVLMSSTSISLCALATSWLRSCLTLFNDSKTSRDLQA